VARKRWTDRAAPPADRARDVQVTVVSASEGHSRGSVGPTAAAALFAAVALAVLAMVAILEDPLHDHQHHGTSAKPNVSVAVLAAASFTPEGNPGQDPIAAAFRGPLRCLSLTYAASDRQYVRAEPATGLTCPSYPAGAMIFRWVDGNPEPILESSTYACPVRSLPVSVQAELGVCPRRAVAG